MSMRKKTLLDVAAAARQVAEMAAAVVEEIENQSTYEHVDGIGYERVEKYPGAPAPEDATHPGYAKSTAALKRRSMDLTRLLAELRRVS